MFTKINDAMLENMPIRQLMIMLNGAMAPSAMEWLVNIIYYYYIRVAKKMKK